MFMLLLEIHTLELELQGQKENAFAMCLVSRSVLSEGLHQFAFSPGMDEMPVSPQLRQ